MVRPIRYQAEEDWETQMADAERNQKHLGIDTNVLVAYLDAEHPSHTGTEWLSKENVALNPTVIHECYHTLVFKMRWSEEEAANVLMEAVEDRSNLFVNQTSRTTSVGLDLAVKHHLGGRDALILANNLLAGIGDFLTFDKTLLARKEIRHGKLRLAIRDLRKDHLTKHSLPADGAHLRILHARCDMTVQTRMN